MWQLQTMVTWSFVGHVSTVNYFVTSLVCTDQLARLAEIMTWTLTSGRCPCCNDTKGDTTALFQSPPHKKPSKVRKKRRYSKSWQCTIFKKLFSIQWRRNECESGSPPVWRESEEGTDPARNAGKNIFGRVPPLFGSKSTISRFDECFCDGQYSSVSFLFAVLLLTVPSHL